MRVVVKEKQELSEKELIELTKEYGYSGAELNNPHFIKKGFLKKNGTYDSFAKKLDSICESWKRLKKKKGQPVLYELVNLYEEAQPIVDKREGNGKQRTPEDETMKEYIFIQLINNQINDNKPYSYKRWGEKFGLLTMPINTDSLVEPLKVLYKQKELLKIVDEFKLTILKRNKDVVEKSFNQLVKEKRIHITELPIFVHLDNSHSIPSWGKFNEVQTSINEALEQFKINKYEYYFYPNNDKVREVRPEIEKIHFSNGLKSLFKGFQVNVIDKQIYDLIDKEQFDEAYKNRLIQLTIERSKLEGYKVNFVQKRFYTFNTLMQMQVIGFAISEESLDRYRPTKEEIEAVHQAQIEYAEQEKEKNQNISYRFGEKKEVRKGINYLFDDK